MRRRAEGKGRVRAGRGGVSDLFRLTTVAALAGLDRDDFSDGVLAKLERLALKGGKANRGVPRHCLLLHDALISGDRWLAFEFVESNGLVVRSWVAM